MSTIVRGGEKYCDLKSMGGKIYGLYKEGWGKYDILDPRIRHTQVVKNLTDGGKASMMAGGIGGGVIGGVGGALIGMYMFRPKVDYLFDIFLDDGEVIRIRTSDQTLIKAIINHIVFKEQI